MNNRKSFARIFFFVFLLACFLMGLVGVERIPVNAAPQMQATVCTGSIFTQWDFNNTQIPSTGSGTFGIGSGLPAPTYAAGSPDLAISFANWTTSTSLDANYYIEFAVPTTGRNTIIFDFEYRATGTAPQFLEIHYSTDGGSNFSLFGAAVALTRDSTFYSLSFDLSSIPTLDDNLDSIFRIYGYAATGAAGSLRIDNATFTGNCINPAPPTETPTAVPPLSLIINEVAWAGTDASTGDEWIELYNPGSSAVNLTGWILKTDDGSPNISLSGSIPAGGYFLLERTDHTTVSDIVADQIYSGELNNSNETLRLYDPSGFVVDTANANGGAWPAGSSTTRGSMERRGVLADSDTAWITNTGVVANGLDADGNDIWGTPKNANWALTVTATPSSTPTRTRTPTPVRTSTNTPGPPPPPPLIAINEFVPRPGHDWNNDGIINTGDEYIELINHGVVDVNLSGYRLDDEANIGSSVYTLPSVVLKPGERIVFYGSQTNLLLSDGGDGVRLLRSNGQLVDAYNYFTVNFPDQSFCRLPDNGGLDDWNTNCYPTPGLSNSLSGSILGPPTRGGVDEPLCPIADTLPEVFVLAECSGFGNNIWNRYYWDKFGWYDEMSLPNVNGKWEVYAD